MTTGMIVDSANVKCDKCGVVQNHHFMYYPKGWARYNNNKDYCPTCVKEHALLTPGQHNEYGMRLGDE